jgi:hypothetical protein
MLINNGDLTSAKTSRIIKNKNHNHNIKQLKKIKIKINRLNLEKILMLGAMNVGNHLDTQK